VADYDVIVIGAGNGGLTAGAQLSARGARVLVLEQHNLPGGFASSFVRGRFEFEPSLHELCDVGPAGDKGGVRKLLEDDLGVEVDFVRVPEAYRMILTTENLDVTMPFGIEEFADAVDGYVPGSRAAVRSYLDLCREVLDALNYLGASKGNPDKKVLLKQHGNFLRTAPYTVEEVTARFGIPEQAKKILYAYWCYIGIPVSKMSFTLWSAMLYKYLATGGYIPRYRSHEMSAAIEERVLKNGGRIEYNTRVDKILVEQGKVTGVETSHGERFSTSHVICNASPTVAYNRLVFPKSEVPRTAYRQVNARTHGSSAFVVYLGLDASPEDLGLMDYSYFIYEHMDIDRLYASFSDLCDPRVQATVCLNRAVPDCSPPGTTIMSFTILYRPGVWDRVAPEDYVSVKRKVADRLIRNFEQAMHVSLRDHIEEIEVATPQTFARYTGSFAGGVYGYEPEPWDSIIPRMMCMQDELYIEGLRFAGGNAFRTYGYSSSLLSGQTVALLTLRDMGVV